MYKIKLSPFQEIFFNEWQIDPKRSDYNIVLDQTLYGGLCVEKLRLAIKNFVKDYLLFNSNIEIIDEVPHWVKSTHEAQLDFFEQPVSDKELYTYISNPFDLTGDRLYRFLLIKYSVNEYRFIFVAQHILISGLTAKNDIFTHLIDNYEDVTQQFQNSWQEQIRLLGSFADKLGKLVGDNLNQGKKFWRNKLNKLEVLDLKFLSLGPNKAKSKLIPKTIIREFRFEFNHNVLIQTNKVAKSNKITSYLFGQMVLAYLFFRYTGQKKFAISYPFAIREASEFIYGAQINTSFIVYDFEQVIYFSDIVAQVKQFLQDVKNKGKFDYRYCPISEIIDISNKGLLDVAFIQTNLKDTPFKFSSIQAVKINNDFNIDLPNKLLFEQEVRDHKINFRVKYHTIEFDDSLFISFIDCYQELYRKILEDECSEDPKNKLNGLSILSSKDYNKIIYKWNSEVYPYPKDTTIHKLFEEQVNKTPNNIAVCFEETKLTYDELNYKSNQLAHYMRNTYKVKANDLIGLSLEKNEYLIIAILAVLKSAAAYVPIDINYSDDRISFILLDTEAKILITNKIHQNKFDHILAQNSRAKDFNSKLLVLTIDDYQNNLEFSKQEFVNLPSQKNTKLAYVIYTSGTTGNPKGVMIEHENLVSFILGFLKYPLNHGLSLNMLSTTNYVFDIFGLEYMLPLLNGYTMYLVDLFKLTNKLDLSNYDCIQITPSKVELLIDSIDYNIQSHCKHDIKLLVGGEILSQVTLQRIYNLSNKLSANSQINIEVINLYGPTEATIWSSAKKIDFKHMSNNLSNIGRALTNQYIYILDDSLNILPIGAVGEIYIGGSGIARGYINQPGLTAEKFIANPFKKNTDKSNSNNCDRLYKTGDLARYLPDGTLEYIGRNDFQVKIRGHRIELSEIEHALNSYPDIERSVILVKNNSKNESDNNSYIVAYYIAKIEIDDEQIITHLIKNLPHYMIPTIFIRIDKIPLNTNGKLDINALPEPDFISHVNYTAPRNELEKEIIKVWAEILELPTDSIGINDNFYQLGGNSLLIIKLKNKLTQINQLRNITTANLFRYTTIKQLAMFIEQEQTSQIIKISRPKHESDIAIISMSGVFSGCETIDQYWGLISGGMEGSSVFTIDECRRRGVSEELLVNPDFIPVSGHIPNIDKFDALFWNIAPHEAKKLDPHIRKFLEICWYLLEDSGYINIRSELNIGVFAGGSYSRYQHLNTSDSISTLDMWSAANLGVTSALATKVSYMMGLTGPSININTACSTSLVAIIEACQKLSRGDCDLAIAGGSSLLMPHEVGHIYQKDMIFSKDGHCRAFDSKASGIIMGSGVGAVLLKRLSDAKKDQDNIIAVIKGYALNNDGNRKISYTAPSEVGQMECIVNAQKMANITSDMIDYVECHGTGTKLGDPIEINALKNAFEYNANKNNNIRSCVLGSVKANIGHTDVAAGVAGLIKVCKMLEHRIIPKQINYDSPNPEIQLEKTNFEIITVAKKWDKARHSPRFAGISSFGIGGTNAHIIIAEHISEIDSIKHIEAHDVNAQLTNYILPLSAKSAISLNLYKEKFIQYLESTQDKFEDILYPLHQKRDFFDFRTSIIGKSKQEAINKLQNSNIVKATTLTQPQDIIFMFPGQGNQYINMSLPLYQNITGYKHIVDECIRIVNLQIGIPFETVLFPKLFNNEIKYDIDQTRWAQIALFVVSFSLASFLEKHLNIRPKAYIGHSIGELVAATLSGVFSLENAIKLVVSRGQLMQLMPEGSMLVIFSEISKIKGSIQKSGCEISVINSPKNYVVSGSKQQVIDLKNSLDKIGITSTILKTSHAYHSSSMEQASKEFINKFDGIRLNKPQRQFISNVTGDFIAVNDAINPEYWAKQIRSRVLFADGVDNLLNEYSNPFFIEVGVGKSLLSAVRNISNNPESVYGVQLLNSLKDNEFMEDTNSTEDIISKLWMSGYTEPFEKYSISVNKLHCTVKLPNYCFEKNTYWADQIKPSSNSQLQILPSAGWLNVPVWKKVAKLSLGNRSNLFNNECFLIFVDKNYTDLDNLIAADNKVLFIKADETARDFILVNDAYIIINPTSENAYQTLAEHLKENNISPSIVIHANTLSTSSFKHNVVEIETHLNNGFYSLFLLQQYILSKLSAAKFVILTQEIAKIAQTDIVNPYNGAMVGALRTIKHELLNIKSCILDIGEHNIHSYKHILEFIKNDSNFVEENLYALKFQSLWIQSFEQMHSGYKELTIENDDVILITGGLGGIGLSIAELVSHKNHVTFILVSRSDIRDVRKPDQYILSQLNVLEKIQSSGSIIDIQCLDISDQSAVNNLIAYIVTKYGRISGIIHTAGSPPIPSNVRSLQTVKKAIAAKIYGVYNLSIAMQHLELKYAVMISSLASIIGDVNRIEYCAANSYLDYVSDSILLPSQHKLTINWPGWSDVGMIAKYGKGAPAALNDIVRLNAINKVEGAQLFYDLIQYKDYSQIIVSKLNLELVMQKLFRKNTVIDLKIDNITTRVLEADLPTLYYKIAAIFLEVLSLEHISIYDNFFNLGGTSLSAIRLIAQLKEIGINFTLTEIINANSVDAIYKLYESNMLEATSDRILVPLCINNASNKNVFFIHAVGGTVIFYLDMVRKLSKNYNYYGIQNINISGKQLIKVATLEELAGLYLKEILKIQPSGEYILMGSSLGGTISYEIAKQLIKLGKTVKYIAMFDTWAVFSSHFKDESVLRTIIEDQIQYDKNSKNFADAVDYEALANARWELMKLLLNYQPQRASISIHLYKALELDNNYATIGEYNDNGWQQYTDINVITYKITGDHVTMHIKPGLDEMVNLLNSSLNSGDVD